MLTRRSLLQVAALAALPQTTRAFAQGAGEPQRLNYETLTGIARDMATKSYVAVQGPDAKSLDPIDYDQHSAVREPVAKALFKGTAFPITFIPLGRLFPKPVQMFSLVDGVATEIRYDASLFDVPKDNPFGKLPPDAGFAGFRVHDGDGKQEPQPEADWTSFLGASYFRASGDERQYGVSARGIAIDTANPRPNSIEAFPAFTRFYLSPERQGIVEVLALLDGPEVVGAYRFRIRRRPNVVFDVECQLFFRKEVARLGIAPATSMYYYSETLRYSALDWRPEIHDSDGLAILTGSGEELWRPLNNPDKVIVSHFGDENPKGFGLLQRDRNYDHYHDDVRQERRPNLWVTPLGSWGKGSVQLVEIPTDSEYNDNIVAFWVPETPVKPGDQRGFAYRLAFSAGEPRPGRLARCTATRLTRGLPTPKEAQRPNVPPLERQFMVEFDGDVLEGLKLDEVKIDLQTSRGVLEEIRYWPEGNGAPRPWRVFFKLFADGDPPVELRMVLRKDGQPVSETWLYQFHPTPA